LDLFPSSDEGRRTPSYLALRAMEKHLKPVILNIHTFSLRKLLIPAEKLGSLVQIAHIVRKIMSAK
jgi:hypothetical protein